MTALPNCPIHSGSDIRLISNLQVQVSAVHCKAQLQCRVLRVHFVICTKIGLIRFIILSFVTLFTYLLRIIFFRANLKVMTIGMVPSNFTDMLPNEIIIEGDYRMLYVVNERMKREHGTDCNFQASEEEGPGCNTTPAASVGHI